MLPFASLLLSAALCPGQQGLLANPPDPSAPGPSPVSSRLLPGGYRTRCYG